VTHRTLAQLDAVLDHVWASPRDAGTVALIVRRPEPLAREIVEEAQLDVVHGMVGDSWVKRPSKRTPDGSPNPEQQLTLMNVRAIEALGDRSEWPLAGDQFFVDLDLSKTNLPTGTRLRIGTAIVVISETPHTGCAKFTERFGSDATKWVNSKLGLELRLRGVNARILQAGVVRLGDTLRRG
jgi:hypothetical protein